MESRTGQWICCIIMGLFSILMTGIFWATMVIDKSFPNLFANTVTYSNVLYYMAAACFGIVMRFLIQRIKISNRAFYVVMFFLFFAVAFIQWRVSTWMLIPNSGGDFGNVMGAAKSIAEGGSFQEFAYFKRSPNNANIAIFLSFLYRIVQDWKMVIFCGALFTNISVMCSCLAIRNISHSNEISLFFALLGEVLLALTWRAFLVYTDNFGMIFTALALWIYTLKLDFKIKIPVFMLVAGMGSYIKVTNAILLLAVGIYQFLVVINSKKKEEFVKTLYGLAVFAVVFSMIIVVQGCLRRNYLLDPGKYAVGWQYLFMVGQNTDYYGVVNEADREWYASLTDSNITEESVKQACLHEAIRRVKSRGFWNISFYLRKLNVAYNDGYFHNVHLQGSYQRQSVLSEIYLLEGKYYLILASILQMLWDFILLCLGVGAYKNKDWYMCCCALMIMGITAYLMLFEGRSKYVYMFLPIFLVTGGISFASTVKELSTLDRRKGSE